jgi:hypothetical protein
MLLSHGPNKTFLVPDSCRAIVRNGSSINADLTEDTIENDYNDACFSYFQAILALVLEFLRLQYEEKIRTLLVNICTRSKPDQKSSPKTRFVPVSTARANIYIFSKQRTLYTVKPVYKGHSREPKNVPFMSSCPLYTG